MNKIQEFKNLASIFIGHGFHLYLVGGTVRDYLLNKELTDMDVVSDATPLQITSFLDNVDTSFAHLGSLKYKNPNGVRFDITTLREESGYFDYRHPSHISYVKDLKLDYKRRDFTINALYMDENLLIYDFVNGQQDLKNHLLRMVGDPNIRLKEDPLRILRAVRFALTFNLDFEEALFKAMLDNYHLLKDLTDAKIRSELAKIDDDNIDLVRKNQLFKQFDIANLQGVIK